MHAQTPIDEQTPVVSHGHLYCDRKNNWKCAGHRGAFVDAHLMVVVA